MKIVTIRGIYRTMTVNQQTYNNARWQNYRYGMANVQPERLVAGKYLDGKDQVIDLLAFDLKEKS